jgi:hypothetical protein
MVYCNIVFHEAGLAEAKRKQAVSSYIQSNKVNYIVYGVDQLCNQYNNGTKTSIIPNCAATTTSIAIATNFAAPTDPSWAVASSATSAMIQAGVVGGSGHAWQTIARNLMQTPFLMMVLEMVVFYVCCSLSSTSGDYQMLFL